jgi:hypothetical protein
MLRKNIIIAAIACGMLASACSSIDTMPRFVGGAPINLQADSGGALSVRYVSAEIGPDALENHMLMRDPDFGRPGRDLLERAQLRDEMEHELSWDVAGEVQEELKACVPGGRPVDVVVRIEDIAYAGFEEEREGADRMLAVAEIFEADGSGPIARYPVEAVSPRRFSVEGQHVSEGVSISINDREDSMAEWLGREVCRQVFGSERRPSRWRNLTQ